MNSAVEYMDQRASVPAPRPIDTDEPRTLVDVFIRVAHEHKRPDTLNYKSEGRWLSVSSDEMLERAKLIAAGLHAIGVKRGDRVAILSESRVEWTLTDAGSIFAGAIDVPIYPTLTPPQVRYILKDSGAMRPFLANREKLIELQETLKECPDVRQLVIFDAEGVTPADGLTLAQLEEKGRELEQREPGEIARLHQKHSPTSWQRSSTRQARPVSPKA